LRASSLAAGGVALALAPSDNSTNAARRVSWFAAGPHPEPLAAIPVEQMNR
jgi:hypothetical protein